MLRCLNASPGGHFSQNLGEPLRVIDRVLELQQTSRMSGKVTAAPVWGQEMWGFLGRGSE